MANIFSLEQIPREERFSFFRNVVEEFYVPVTVECETPETFDHWRKGARLGQVDVGIAHHTKIRVSRTLSHIGRSEDDRVKVIVPLSGAIEVTQGSNGALVRTGQFYLIDGLRPSKEHITDDLTFIYLLLPRQTMTSHGSDFEKMTATALDCNLPYARLATDFARSLSNVLDSMEGAATANVGSIAADLFTMALWERQGTIRTHSTIYRSTQYEKARAFIDCHFADADLRLDMVAKALHMSPRSLSELFSESGTSYRQYILDRRLVQAARELCDPRLAHVSITEIAYKCGFYDGAHFSRAFRAKFEMSPREYRFSDASLPTNYQL